MNTLYDQIKRKIAEVGKRIYKAKRDGLNFMIAMSRYIRSIPSLLSRAYILSLVVKKRLKTGKK